MLKKIASVCVLGIASITSTTASAAPEMNNFYYGVSLGFMNTDFLDRFEDLESASDNVLVARFGGYFNKNISAEIRYGVGLGRDMVSNSTEAGTFNMFGAYLRAGHEFSNNLYPYVMLGYTQSVTTISSYNQTLHTAAKSISYGVGADYKFNDKITINAEYAPELSNNDFMALNGFTLGVSTQF